MSKTNSITRLFVFVAVCVFIATGVSPTLGQSGGIFTITQATVAGGGGLAAGGSSSLVSTAGQAAAGSAMVGPGIVITSGFWKFSPLAPTAAMVSIGGRIKTASGQGIPNAILTLFRTNGSTRTLNANPFGYYQFDHVPAGETIVIGVWRKGATFTEPTVAVNVYDEVTDLDFIGEMN